ncbi:hypothetical protein E2C01_072056 [Portunus trituberculatus]|uniref:Uncharacterized protein n=1 Tax=Portunus trituberculatus TaxID=210409 RepID=A0A5B7I6R9_PORTR|nr:hypothetical protein [Portunus trituberculatus]
MRNNVMLSVISWSLPTRCLTFPFPHSSHSMCHRLPCVAPSLSPSFPPLVGTPGDVKSAKSLDQASSLSPALRIAAPLAAFLRCFPSFHSVYRLTICICVDGTASSPASPRLASPRPERKPIF